MGVKVAAPPGLNMPPPAAHAPTLGNSAVALAGLEQEKRAKAAEGAGNDNTVATSSRGVLQAPNTAKQTLLAQ